MSSPRKPKRIPRFEHRISPAFISKNALKVIERLLEAGFEAHLVGGCVRDLMLGREPKDFDVVTDARPREIRRLFRNSRLIGRRFRLAHVRFGREIIEVATFRAAPDNIAGDDVEGEFTTDDGRILRDNVFGTQEEDAVRRDFTVNALYLDGRDFAVVDYVGGAEDLRRGVLRVIGDPETRYREDPVRMLRAVRFAAKLGFRMEARTAAPIRELAPLVAQAPPARLFDEVLKLFHGGYALQTYELLRRYGLFEHLFPLTEQCLAREREGYPLTLLPHALASTDQRVAQDKPVTPAFLFAALLWEPVRTEALARAAEGMSQSVALEQAARRVVAQQVQRVSIPKRFSGPMREIWTLQPRFARRGGRRALRLLEHRRFRAAYDFLLLRAASGEEDPALADWWTRFQELDRAGREAAVKALGGGRRGARPGRRGASR